MSLAESSAGRMCATTLVVASLLVAALGCPQNSPGDNSDAGPTTRSPPTVRLLVVDDEALAATIEREWKASGRGDLAISRKSASELGEVKRLPADVVIYPAALLGDFAERHLLAELPVDVVEDETFASNDLFPLLRRRECTWGEKLYAVPFGSPQLLLLYRKDLLEKIGRPPPATWAEYQDLVAVLKSEAAGSEIEFAAAEPTADGWGAKLLLARAAAYARHPNQYSALFDYQTMEPLIATAPYVRALEDLVGVQQASPDREPLTAAECEQAMIDGRCALAITWPTRSAARNDDRADAQLGCTELPGATQIYNFGTDKWTDAADVSHVPLLGVSGRIGSITTSARHTGAAADALVWLAGKEKGPLIASQCPACTLYRSSQVPQASRFVSDVYDMAFADAYGATLENTNERPLSMEMPRIPGHEEYLAALDLAVQSAVTGGKTPLSALDEAAVKWREITQKHGTEHQKPAYLRSLGLEP